MSELAIRDNVLELDARESDQIAVHLLYERLGNTVLIHLIDHKEDFDETFPVPADQAQDAFHHPYAYYGDYQSRHQAAA